MVGMSDDEPFAMERKIREKITQAITFGRSDGPQTAMIAFAILSLADAVRDAAEALGPKIQYMKGAAPPPRPRWR